MNAGLLGGALLLGLGAGAWVWLRRQERGEGSSTPLAAAAPLEGPLAAVAPPEDPLAARLDAQVRARRQRLHDRVAAIGAGCALVGLMLVLTPFVAPQPQMRAGEAATLVPSGAAPLAKGPTAGSAPDFPATPGTTARPAGPGSSPAPAAERAPVSAPVQAGDTSGGLLATTLAFVAAGGLALVVGALLLGLAPGWWAKAVGTAMVALGLTANGYLVKEVKFGDILKFETRIDKASIELDFRTRLAELAQFGPEQLGSFEDFESGLADIRPHMKDALNAACARWKAQGGREQRGVLLVIGSTDRTRLAAASSRQYESNVGLARARAEQVRTRLVEQCDVPPSQLVTLVSGPRHTPADAAIVPAEDAAKDRSVAVWALWSLPRK